MPASNSNLISACRAPVNARMWRRCSWLVRSVECLVLRLREKVSMFVQSHDFPSTFCQEAPGTLSMKMPNVVIEGQAEVGEARRSASPRM